MKLEKLLTTILFLSVAFILVFNIFTYDPIQGYDAEAHHEYVNNFFSIFVINYDYFYENIKQQYPQLLREKTLDTYFVPIKPSAQNEYVISDIFSICKFCIIKKQLT